MNRFHSDRGSRQVLHATHISSHESLLARVYALDTYHILYPGAAALCNPALGDAGFRPLWLIIPGTSGTGKSFLLAALFQLA